MKDLYDVPKEQIAWSVRTLKQVREKAEATLWSEDKAPRNSQYVEEMDELGAANRSEHDARTSIHAHMFVQCNYAVTNAFDHIKCMERTIVPDSKPNWGTLSLARVALESFTMACYLIEPSIDVTTRLLRSSALWMHSTYQQLLTAEKMQSGIHQEIFDNSVNEFEHAKATVKKAGFAVNPADKRKPSFVEFQGNRVSAQGMNLAGEIDRLHGEFGSAYNITSGASHSLIWMIRNSGTTIGGFEEGPPPDLGRLNMSVLSAVRPLQTFYDFYGRYFGFDLSALARNIEGRLQAGYKMYLSWQNERDPNWVPPLKTHDISPFFGEGSHMHKRT